MNAKCASCRGCGGHTLKPILSLGKVPLANALLTEDRLHQDEQEFPLDLVFCPQCTLVQITETVSPDRLFGDYLYFSSFSDTMLAHASALVDRLISERNITNRSKIVEIASNDGYLLQFYKKRAIPVLGIEPAANIAAIAERERRIPTVVDFFNRRLAARLAAEGQQADIVHANNVFAHTPDPNEFIAGLKIVLKTEGIAVIEAPYVKDMIDKVEFDTIYHEHFSYFSLTAVDRLLRRHGLAVTDVEHLSIHGGSLRYFVSHDGDPVSERVPAVLQRECAWGVDDYSFYQAFADRVAQLRDDLVALLRNLKSKGNRIAAYGASAKGSTLLNAFGIGADILEFVVDRSTVKQGRYTPGTHLPILAPEALLDRKPDYVLLLTWNFASEILDQQAAYREAGGRFLIPVPEVKIV